MRSKVLRWGVPILVIGLLVIQVVPYGRSHANPAVRQEPPWDSPQTRELAVRACYDCHSNETIWPWYSNIAPVSWITQQHVAEGRAQLNFSDWSPLQEGVDQAARTVQNGEMPPRYYTPIHGPAALTDAERQALSRGLTATFRLAGAAEWPPYPVGRRLP